MHKTKNIKSSFKIFNFEGLFRDTLTQKKYALKSLRRTILVLPKELINSRTIVQCKNIIILLETVIKNYIKPKSLTIATKCMALLALN